MTGSQQGRCCSSRLLSTPGDRFFGFFFRDVRGLESLHRIGVDNMTFETDYPHGDSTWPDALEIAREMFAVLPDDVVYKIVRGNAMRMLG